MSKMITYVFPMTSLFLVMKLQSDKKGPLISTTSIYVTFLWKNCPDQKITVLEAGDAFLDPLLCILKAMLIHLWWLTAC